MKTDLRELGLFSLKRRLRRHLRTVFQRPRTAYLKGSTRNLERDFLQGHVVTLQGEIASG